MAETEIKKMNGRTICDETARKSIPTKLSQLTNDSGFLKSIPSEYVTETELNAKGYITDAPTKTSQLTNDSGFLTAIPSEYVTETELSAKGYAKQTAVDNLSKEIVDLQNYVTPQMFGAIGDGTNDDTTAINSALASGKNVFFPVGTYKVTAPLVVPYGIILSGASGLSTIKTYITDGYVFKSETSNVLESLNLENLKFENGNTQDTTTKLASGNFIYDCSALYMRNCRVYKYYDVFYFLHANSYIKNCRFNGTYHSFCHIITDSVVDGNYINASRYGLPHKAKVFDGSFNSTTFTNNLVDYFFDCFAVTSSASGSVVGNMFNRCVNVFHDHLRNMTVVGNMFTAIKSSEVDLSILTTEQIASLEAEKWCVIKFDNDISTGTHLLQNVIFSNNMGYKCDNYIYVADGTQVVPSNCEFRGNQITKGSDGQPSSVDVGFRSEQATIDAYNSMHNVFFDFWDMKEYETLPSANLIGSGAKSIFTFPYMRAVHNGDIYTNINGEWVKGGGGEDIDLSPYLTEDDLEGYATKEEVSTEITQLKVDGVSQIPAPANSVEECTDKTKIYLLPDGYVYGNVVTTEEVDTGTRPNFTNLKEQATFRYSQRYSLSGGAFKAAAGTSIAVPVPSDKTSFTLRLQNFARISSYPEIYGGTSDSAFTDTILTNIPASGDSEGIITLSLTKNAGITYIVFNATGTTEDDFTDLIITIDEPIEYVTETETVTTEKFVKFGMACLPADYVTRLEALENKVATL